MISGGTPCINWIISSTIYFILKVGLQRMGFELLDDIYNSGPAWKHEGMKQAYSLFHSDRTSSRKQEENLLLPIISGSIVASSLSTNLIIIDSSRSPC